MMVLTYVNNVTQDVLIVKTLPLGVPNVSLQEKTPQIVPVH